MPALHDRRIEHQAGLQCVSGTLELAHRHEYLAGVSISQGHTECETQVAMRATRLFDQRQSGFRRYCPRRDQPDIVQRNRGEDRPDR
ncbi:MAG: hypothetical protein R2848_08790 [Thermomicrobiales bacterium]